MMNDMNVSHLPIQIVGESHERRFIDALYTPGKGMKHKDNRTDKEAIFSLDAIFSFSENLRLVTCLPINVSNAPAEKKEERKISIYFLEWFAFE